MSKSKVQWNGITTDGRSVSTIWGNNSFTWGDVALAIEVSKALSSPSRRKQGLNKLLQDTDKKKKLIHLICRIKGEKVYDDFTEFQDVEVQVEDAELVVETIVKKVKLEIK